MEAVREILAQYVEGGSTYFEKHELLLLPCFSD